MLCCTSLFIFTLCRHVTFYKTLMSLSTFFIKPHVGLLQLLKWPCHTSLFTHVEPYHIVKHVYIVRVCHNFVFNTECRPCFIPAYCVTENFESRVTQLQNYKNNMVWPNLPHLEYKKMMWYSYMYWYVTFNSLQ